MNIYQRMQKAMEDIGTVKKDKKNTFQNYEYVSDEAIKAVVHKALVKHGIIFTLSCTKHEMDKRDGTNSQGKPVTMTTSRMSFVYHFTNVDEPTDQIEGCWESSADDTSDKSHTKAITYAIREIIKSNFVISTGEPDPDGETPQIAKATVYQQSNKKSADAYAGATEAQIKYLSSLRKTHEMSADLDEINKMSRAEVSAEIDKLTKTPVSAKDEEPPLPEEMNQVEINVDDIPF